MSRETKRCRNKYCRGSRPGYSVFPISQLPSPTAHFIERGDRVLFDVTQCSYCGAVSSPKDLLGRCLNDATGEIRWIDQACRLPACPLCKVEE